MTAILNKVSLLEKYLCKHLMPQVFVSQTYLNSIYTKRNIHWKKLSNKRITRLETDIEINDCEEYKSKLINRNPRNLEQLSFEKKPNGYFLQKTGPLHWNTLSLENDGKILVASLKHWSGRTIVKASSDEPQLAKYFNSPTSIQAATVLAQVIARRCLQSGYLTGGFGDKHDDQNLSTKEKAFFDSVQENGFTLSESPEITPRVVTDL